MVKKESPGRQQAACPTKCALKRTGVLPTPSRSSSRANSIEVLVVRRLSSRIESSGDSTKEKPAPVAAFDALMAVPLWLLAPGDSTETSGSAKVSVVPALVAPYRYNAELKGSAFNALAHVLFRKRVSPASRGAAKHDGTGFETQPLPHGSHTVALAPPPPPPLPVLLWSVPIVDQATPVPSATENGVSLSVPSRGVIVVLISIECAEGINESKTDRVTLAASSGVVVAGTVHAHVRETDWPPPYVYMVAAGGGVQVAPDGKVGVAARLVRPDLRMRWRHQVGARQQSAESSRPPHRRVILRSPINDGHQHRADSRSCVSETLAPSPSCGSCCCCFQEALL